MTHERLRIAQDINAKKLGWRPQYSLDLSQLHANGMATGGPVDVLGMPCLDDSMLIS